MELVGLEQENKIDLNEIQELSKILRISLIITITSLFPYNNDYE